MQSSLLTQNFRLLQMFCSFLKNIHTKTLMSFIKDFNVFNQSNIIVGLYLFKQCHLQIIILPGHAMVQTGHQCSDRSLPSSSVMVAVYAYDHQLLQLKDKD